LCPACLLAAALDGADDTMGTSPALAAASSFPQKFGDYELLGEIARGGQGVVYRARHSTLHREVALKMFPLSPWTTAADLERSRNEARMSAELDHPAIVPIYDIGEARGQQFFTMKLIEGASLNACREMSPRRAATIIAEAAHAIHHAHERGVLHRDIKPANILIDRSWRPHITDFGRAKTLASENALTRTHQVLGTPGYLSPEVATENAKALSPATDVYGLGAVLYQLLTHNPPFAGGTTLETIRQIVETEPRRPRLWNPHLDRDLETICLKCLEKDPSQRYESAVELAKDLERWLRHEAIRARPGSIVYRTRKWLRRNPRLVAISAALVIFAGAVGWSWRDAPAGQAPRYSLAILMRGADADSRYLAAEYSRNLIHLLDHLPGLKLAPRSEVLKWETSSAPAQTAARAIGVPRIVSGTLRQSGGTLQLRIDLIDVASGNLLWTRAHDGATTPGNELQTQIARGIASHLGIPLGGKQELRASLTTNPEAWAHYLHGRQLLESQSEPRLLEAVTEFEQAIARDPNFAQAYAGLADAHLDLGYTFREPATHFAKAKENVRAALQHDDTLPEALVANGVLSYFNDWDWSAAERAVKQALLLDPSKLENHACYLHCLETVGRVEESLQIVHAAAEAHPASIFIQSELGCATYYAARFAEAETHWRAILKRDPENAYLRWGLARTLAQQQRFEDAARELETAQAKPGGDWAVIVAELAYVRGRQDRHADATRGITTLRARAAREFVDPYLFAIVHAGLGEPDAVFQDLDRAIAVRSTWMPSLPIDPKFTRFRSDPRFRALLTKLKLPATP
jgi:TolB-like protein/tRNA A-37 threonylcarbamoyl transferase component Bud32/Tfp pilus assembly protein PilF